MDDLAGLDWSTPNQSSHNRPPPLNNAANYYPSLKPTPPISGRSTPTVINAIKPPATPNNVPTPKVDSFANLLPGATTIQVNKTLSLREQQELLEEQRRQQSIGQSRKWDTLGLGSSSTSASVSRTASPSSFSVQALNGQSSGPKLPVRSITPSQSISNEQPKRHQSEDVNDILAAFNASAPVDSSTNFPVPSRPESRNVVPASKPVPQLFGDDDDPFGLGTTAVSASKSHQVELQPQQDDNDVLGLLGKPISELPPPKSTSPAPQSTSHPVDGAVAELVDMGFDADKARNALATTESGLDIQGAVGYLLTQAHSEARSKVRQSSTSANGDRERREVDAPHSDNSRKQHKSQSRHRLDPDESVLGKDSQKYAAEIGNNLLKTAGSLWKAGQKKVNKAIADYNADGDTSQPKWMRGAATVPESPSAIPASRDATRQIPKANGQAAQRGENMTDEAALLEIDGGRPQPIRKSKSSQQSMAPLSDDSGGVRGRQNSAYSTEKPLVSASSSNSQLSSSSVAARTRLTREMNEEAPTYISPARRKRAAKQSEEKESNLLFDDSPVKVVAPKMITKTMPNTTEQQAASFRSSAAKAPTIPASRPPAKAPVRQVPSIPPPILQSSTSNRNSGTAAFKLGNYSDAQAFYSAALRDIPKTHPLMIVLLTNRALTSIKTGDPKQCITDADQALEVIGVNKGANEMINLGGSEGTKDMGPYWGKAMMRRAEAMEQLERWSEAAQVWRECVEAGVGGLQSVQGRSRCEKASGAKPVTSVQPRKTVVAPKKVMAKPAARSAMDDLAGKPINNTADSSEAVTRLRAANDAAAKLDDERFALTDAVADRVEAWKKGKEQNLRALLGSLDTVLWADSGWKKIGMSDLLNPSKVKINYMKGIAKVHPDKLPPTATTEQIMISGAVFSTLNEAWDGFKKENGL